MDDYLTLFLTASRGFGERVHAVRDDQWDAPTPATEWTVADLVDHVIDNHRWAPPLLHGQNLETAGQIVAGTRDLPVDGGVGANLAESWDEAATGSSDAFSADGALERTVELTRGPTPARTLLAEMLFDLVVHSWDLGTAIGYAQPVPDELVEPVWAAIRDSDLSAFGDMFGPPVQVPDDASTLDKLVAATGRNPR